MITSCSNMKYEVTFSSHFLLCNCLQYTGYPYSQKLVINHISTFRPMNGFNLVRLPCRIWKCGEVQVGSIQIGTTGSTNCLQASTASDNDFNSPTLSVTSHKGGYFESREELNYWLHITYRLWIWKSSETWIPNCTHYSMRRNGQFDRNTTQCRVSLLHRISNALNIATLANQAK